MQKLMNTGRKLKHKTRVVHAYDDKGRRSFKVKPLEIHSLLYLSIWWYVRFFSAMLLYVGNEELYDLFVCS